MSEVTTRTTDRRRQLQDNDQNRGAGSRQGKFEKKSKFNCYNCGGEGHYSRDCPSGDSFPRGRKQKRGRAARGGGSVCGRGLGQRYLHEVEEEKEDVEDDVDFSSLSLNSITVDTGCFPSIGNSVSVDTLSQLKRTSKRFVTLRLHKVKHNTVKEMKCKVDTGAEANVMPLREYIKLCQEGIGLNGLPKDKFVEKNDAVLKAYGNTVIKQLGRVHLPCEFKGLKFTCGFFLADVEGPILLGLPTCEALGIVKFIDLNATSKIKQNAASFSRGNLYVHPSTPIDKRPSIKNKADLKKMYPECFTNVTNCFPDYEYHIELDMNVRPVIHAPRRIPLELKEKVRQKINEMTSEDILCKVDEPTDWVNSMVVETKSDGRLRICLDPTDLNNAIKRDHYPVPALEDLTPEFAGSDTFGMFWHVKLDKESSILTTFNTIFGRYRYLRMPFGLNMSQDVFQRKIDEVYEPCAGAVGIADDIAVHGKGSENHDLHLHAAMERTRKYNISLNNEKTLIKERSIQIFGNIYSAEGVKPDPDKVRSIQALRPPESKDEMRTFIGMLNCTISNLYYGSLNLLIHFVSC